MISFSTLSNFNAPLISGFHIYLIGSCLALGEMSENPSWSHEGYRVDVSYISDNILVCTFPPTKSDVYELKRFLDDKHRVSL